MMSSEVRTVGEQMDMLPLNAFHRKLLGLIGAGLFLDGFDLYLTAGVLGALVKSGWSNLHLNADFVSLTFIGMLVGAWMAGVIGDRYGRRVTYQFNLALFGGASLLAVFAPNMSALIALRFFMGVGLGAEVVVGYATLTEFVPAASRGKMIGWLAVITNSSLIVSTFLGLWIIPSLGWRYMFGLVGIGSLVVWFLRKQMPESPRWLEANGRHEEALRILAQVRAPGTDSQAPTASGASQQRPKGSVHGGRTVSVWTVFQPPVLGRTLMGVLINVVIGFSLYGFINWLPTFMVTEGVSIVHSLTWLTVMGLGAPAGAAIGLLLADRIGRRTLIVGASLWSAVFGVLFAMLGKDASGGALMITGFLLFIGIYVILAVAFALHVPELFATEYRMRGSGVCNTAGRIATAGVQYVVIAVFAAAGAPGVVGLLVGLLVLQAIVFAIWGVETAGQSLESISSPV